MHRRLADPRGLPRAVRRPHHGAAARCRRGHPRQDEHGRVRDGLVDRALAPTARRPTRGTLDRVPGRQQRRLGRCRRGVPRAPVDRHGHGRLDPPAGGAVRDRRHEADVRAGQSRTASWRSPARSTRSGRSPAMPATPRRCCTPSPAATSATRRRRRCPCPDDAHRPARERRRGRGVAAGQAPRPAAGVLRGRHGARRRGARSAKRSPRSRRPARSSRRSPARTPTTASRRTTSSRPAEASANLARYDGIRYGPRLRRGRRPRRTTSRRAAAGFGAEVKRRIMLGTYALSAGYYDAYYLKAQKVRTLIKARLRRALGAGLRCARGADVADGRLPVRRAMADPVAMYLSDACTLPVNMAGLPGISIPCGLSEGLPVGLQLIGAAWSEARAVRPGARLRGDHRRTPSGGRWSRPSSRGRRSGDTRRRRAMAADAERRRRDRRAARPDRDDVRSADDDRAVRPPLAERALSQRVRPCRRRASAGSSTSSRRWTTSSASGWGSRTSTRRGSIVEAGVESLREGRTHYTSQLRDARAAARAGRAPRAALRRRATTRRPRCSITVGASEAVDLALRATCDPGDEVILHEPSYVAYVPAVVFAGGRRPPRADPVRGRLRARPGRRRGGDHAADEGALPRLPVQPDRRRAAATRSRTSSRRSPSRHDLLVYSDEIYDRLAYGDLSPSRDERPARACASGRS